MDLLGALPDEVILEVFDEEWVKMVDYEHIPFRCRKCHEHGHLLRDCPLNREEDKSKLKAKKDTENFQKVSSRGKGSKKEPKQQHKEGQKASQNKFQALVEMEDMPFENQSMGKDPTEKEKEEENTPKHSINEEEETRMSETDLEDHELQEIIDKENLDLEGFLQQGTRAGIDSLPPDECNRIQQLFLWKT